MMNILRKIKHKWYRVFRTSNTWDLEIHVVDHCNLGCKCCSHYSSVAPVRFYSPSELGTQLKRISPIISGHIRELHLLGGEPLLHPQIEEIVKIVRKYLPTDSISIITNGLLIPKMPASFFYTLREYNIKLSVSEYPLKFDYSDMVEHVKEKGIEIEKFHVLSKRPFQRRPLNEKGKERWFVNSFNCPMKGICMQLYDGRLYLCAAHAYLGFLNKAFGTNFVHKKGTYLNIDDIRSINDILRFIFLPNKACSYCDRSKWENIEWEQSCGAKDEWIL